MYFVAALTIGAVVHCWLIVRALRDEHVAAWAAVVPPLAVFAAARSRFVEVSVELAPQELASFALEAAPMGWLLVGLGLTAFIAGLWQRLRGGDGTPALAQLGALSLLVGVLWTPFLVGYAQLWTLWDAPPERIVEAAAAQEQALWWPEVCALVVAVLLFLPVAVWGYRRDRWEGIGEGVAAAVLVALTLTTGRPAVDAVSSAERPLRDLCAWHEGAGVERASGERAVRSGVLVRIGAEGTPEGFDGSEWISLAKDDSRVRLWVGEPPADRPPVGGGALLAGYTPVQIGGWYGEHPVVVAASCRAHAIH